MFCTRCGAEMPDTQKFCTKCGAPLDAGDVPESDWSGSTAVFTPAQGTAAQDNLFMSNSNAIDPAPANKVRVLPAWGVALGVFCAILVCVGAGAAFVLWGGFGSSSDEVTHEVKIVSPSEEDDDEPSSSTPESATGAGDAPARTESQPRESDGQNTSSNAGSEAHQPAAAAPAPAENSATEPFWGVWIGAFREYDNAVKRAADAESHGFTVRWENSSDWDGFSTKNLYVLSVGTYGSEAEARSALGAAQQYYGDAYVAYSGAYVG